MFIYCINLSISTSLILFQSDQLKFFLKHFQTLDLNSSQYIFRFYSYLIQSEQFVIYQILKFKVQNMKDFISFHGT